MALPKMKEIELALLSEIEAAGGTTRPRDVYHKVTVHFPQITDCDLRETISSGANRWTNRVQWVRQRLILKGELNRYPRGTWQITEKGKKRLQIEGLLQKEIPSIIKEPAVKQQTRHDELKQKMIDIGEQLGYYTETEQQGPHYKNDVLWKQGLYRTPSHVIEICDGGSLPKDFDALHWANDPKNWGAKGILVVTDEKEFEKAKKRFAGQYGLTVVMADTVDTLFKMVDEYTQFLQIIFEKD